MEDNYNPYHLENPDICSTIVSGLLKEKIEDVNKEFSVLEIGCNEGRNLLYLEKHYPNVRLYGTDINKCAIDQARQYVCGGHIYYNDIQELALPQDIITEKFDYIILADVLEHLRNPYEVLTYVKQFLTENGSILCVIPNLMHFSVLKELLINCNFKYTETGLLDKTHIHLFTWNECLRMFGECNLNVETIYFMPIDTSEPSDLAFINKLIAFNTNAYGVQNIRDIFVAFEFMFELKAA